MNLIPILQKHFKEGNKLYSILHGRVTFVKINPEDTYPIVAMDSNNMEALFTSSGNYFEDMGECVLFPDTKKSWDAFIQIEEGDAVVYLKDEVWHLGRAAKRASINEIGVKDRNGDIYFPEKIVKAELFDFDNFENMKL